MGGGHGQLPPMVTPLLLHVIPIAYDGVGLHVVDPDVCDLGFN